MHILIAGGTGFIGQALGQKLHLAGHHITVLGRQASNALAHGKTLLWNGHSAGPWIDEIGQVDVGINLCGRSVDCRKTPENCDAILRSRVDSTRCLRQAFQQTQANPPALWLQMSTAHIYGDPDVQLVDETASYGYGLAPTVGQAWEAACHNNPLPNTREVFMRTSFVLGCSGGAFPILVKLARLGLSGAIGNGRQGISWIHSDDFCALCQLAIEDPSMSGVYNFTAPQPVSQKQFMKTVHEQIGGFFGLPSPTWLTKIGAGLMGRDPELVLYGRYCISIRLPSAGFQFPNLDSAVADLLHKR